ncbi:MAG: hypothetical protein LBB67_00195 [Oscillospiraceae bacterium]|nr:hypothetical protein [Oscillospiraceae bacterium]
MFKREKSKWMVALLLCVMCLGLCVSFMAAPTLADPDEEGETVSTTESSSVSETSSESSSESSVSSSESSSVSSSESSSVSSSVSSSESLESATSTTENTEKTAVRAVAGYKNLFEMLGEDGKSKEPRELYYAVGGSLQPAYAVGEKYYTAAPGYDALFLAIAANGTLNTKDAIYLGEDGKFGTLDDKVAELKSDMDYYFEIAQGVWKLISNIRADALPTTSTTESTVTTTTTTTTRTDADGNKITTTTTTNSFLTAPSDDGKSVVPKTGETFNYGIAVCAMALLMGSVYCGYRLLRKEDDRTMA